MSDQVQIFWDPYLGTLVFETPNLNPPSLPPPAVVTPDEFQAPPTTVAIFQRDPNAPLGSFQNPHPPSTEAGVPYPNMATPAASAQPQATIQWQLDPSAPLGTYRNAHPYIPPTPAAAPPAPTWQADFARIFNSMNLNPSTSEPPVPGPPPQAQPAADALATAAAPSPQATIPNPPPSSPHRRHRPRSHSRDRSSSSGRHVRFADEGARLRANTAAAAQANRRALENELETREYIDASNAIPPRRHRRRTPTPPPAASAWNPTPAPPQPRSSSTASIIDPLTTRDAPIPAAPSRNPGFQDPRRDAPAGTRRAEMAEVGMHERWPRCTVCEDLPATRGRSGIGVCEECYKEGFVAEERRGRSEERRGRSRERR
ncbi:hypothetical protein XANCAGTX0491_003802 [Xanthoria calcicola]